ncbi:MAG: hypothetical protein HYX72_10375 [Acidobacteria bacterium]|nr:hypothetical protein [Acidobacteriota bacterium]
MPAHHIATPRMLLFVAVLLLLLPAVPCVVAQESAESAQGGPVSGASETPAGGTPAPLTLGDYTLSGSGSFGYRFLNLEGNHAKYNQLLNLQEGFRVFSADFSLQPTEGGTGWFDRMWVTTQGLGGDPFPTIRAVIRKADQYELRTGYRSTQYFYDLPQTDFTNNRAWHARRRFADADLRYTPTKTLSLRFFYNRSERLGTDLSGSPFFYIPLGQDVWQALGRFDSIPWAIPLREQANMYGGGLDYQLGTTHIHVEQNYRTFNNPANLQTFGGQPVVVRGPLTPVQNVIVERWDTLAAFNIPTTSVFIEHEVNGHLQLRGGFVHLRASGPASLDGSLSQGASLLRYIGTGTTKLNVQTADAGFTWTIFKPVELMSDYRYQSYAERGTQSIQALRSDLPLPMALSDDTLRWDFGVHIVDSVLAVFPSRTLTFRGGLRFVKRDIVRMVDGETAPGTRRTWTYTPLINAAWTPSRKFSLRGDFESRVNVDPYVRITPESSVGSKIRARFSPSDKWGIDNTFMFRNLSTEDLSFEAHTRSNSTNLWFQPLARVGFQGGFSYLNFSSENSIRFLRGTPPLTGLLSTDQTVDRIFTAGVNLNPVDALTLGFTGQFVRSTGLGTITRESSMYGPLTWPAWSAEIGFNTKNLGRVVFSWQRSYYYEDLFRAMDYSSHAFTLRFERAF